jgi:dipeptide/tripeptide permease
MTDIITLTTLGWLAQDLVGKQKPLAFGGILVVQGQLAQVSQTGCGCQHGFVGIQNLLFQLSRRHH